MNKILQISITVLTGAFITWTPQLKAETLNTSASFVVHESDMTQFLKDQTNKWLTPSQIIADQIAIDSPYHSLLKEVSWQGNASLNWTKNPKNNVWVFDGQATNLTLYAATFEVHDTLQVTVGGSTINVRVDATCQNLSMNMPGQWKLKGEVPANWANGSLTAPLQNVVMVPSAQVPVIKVASCQGPTGVEQFLNQQVAKLFANPSAIQNAIVSEVQKLINSQIGQLMAKMGQPVNFEVLGAKVSFTPTMGASLPSGTMILDGPLVLQAAKGEGVKTVPQGYTIANLSDARASGFAFSNNLWSEILAFADRGGLTARQFKSSEVEQFQSFQQSRLQQFFVWGDMMNFSTSQPFNFNVRTTGPMKLESQTNLFPGVAWDVSAPVDVRMDAVYEKSVVPYVQFWSRNPAQATLAAVANEDGSLDVTYSLLSLDMNYGYRKEFFKIRQPAVGIGVDMITSSIVSSETDQVWNFRMPDSASPLPGYRINFKDIIFGKKTFRFEMGLQKK